MTIGFTSCNNDPADAVLFVGRYEGTASFASTKDGFTAIVDEPVKILVSKVGDTYTFKFSSEKGKIPTLKNVTLQKGENTLVTATDSKFGVVKIDGESLTIAAYTTSEGSWSASAKRI